MKGFGAAVGQGLNVTGYHEGQNVVIEYRAGKVNMPGCRAWWPIWSNVKLP